MHMYFFCASAFPGDVVDGEWFQVLGVVVGGVSSDDLFCLFCKVIVFFNQREGRRSKDGFD